MRVLLVDFDSKPGFANLALMQASTYHRAQGDSVELYRHALPRRRIRRSIPIEVPRDPERVYVSCVFAWNGAKADTVRRNWPFSQVFIGGTGWDIWRAGPGVEMSQVLFGQMPPAIAAATPDYDLYGYDYALGFCNRGCDRACKFCVVHPKEGGIKRDLYRHPRSWVPDGFRKAMVLDNDVALYPVAQQREIFEWFTEAGVKHVISQGYDLRCVAQNPELARIVAANMPYDVKFGHHTLYTAWDYLGNETPVRLGLRALIDAGVRPGQIACYVISGNPLDIPHVRTDGSKVACGYLAGGASCADCHREALYRFKVLREDFDVLPYLMPYNNRQDDPWLTAFTRYVDRGPASYRTHTFADYLQRHPRVRTSEGIVDVVS